MTPKLRYNSYTELSERLAPVLDCGALVAVGDYVRVWMSGADCPIYADVIEIREDIEYAKVESWNGSQRWVSLDEVTLILKGGVREEVYCKGCGQPLFQFEQEALMEHLKARTWVECHNVACDLHMVSLELEHYRVADLSIYRKTKTAAFAAV